MTDIIVIGAGASGLMAASAAAACGASVLVLEKMKQPGRKLLATGNGRCNLSNLRQEPSCYRSETPDLAWQIYAGHPSGEILEYFRSLGIPVRSHGGYLYPMSEQARSVLQALLGACERANPPVKLRLNTQVTAICKKHGRFLVYAGDYPYEASCVILAAGSKAAPVFGTDGDGFSLAESLGHHVTRLSPALTGILCKEQSFFRAVAGVRAAAAIRLETEEGVLSEEGEVQFAEYGLSGIPAFQLSRFVGLSEKKELPLTVDFVPEWTEEMLTKALEEGMTRDPAHFPYETLSGILPEKAARAVSAAGEGLKPKELAALIKHFPFTAIGVRGYEDAQVCAGGVSLKEIDPKAMESRLTEGLYLTGEVLDVDGLCGGYNLQWAWTTGFTAGRAAAASVKGGHK